jgi:hypothetical protein
MEKKNQLIIGLLILALGIGGFVAYNQGLFGTKSLTGKSAMAAAGMTDANTSGNIPGTNVNANIVESGPSTTIKYDNERFDFGSANEGDIVKHVFKFTNTGSEPLVISNAKGSCGCTVPTWPKEAIAPGAVGEIAVEFNTSGKPGRQSKRITVTANTVPTDTFIEIAGEVKPKATAKG